MADPRSRLHRHVLGETLHQQRPVVEQVAARDRDISRPDPVSQHREPVEYRIKKRYPPVQAEPNAPQLIRLVRTPFALDKGYFKRVDGGERAKVEKRERMNVGAELLKAREAGRRVPFPKPTDAHPRIARPARPSLDDYLASSGRRG